MEGDQEKETTTAVEEISVYTAVAVVVADVKEKQKNGTEGFSHSLFRFGPNPQRGIRNSSRLILKTS